MSVDRYPNGRASRPSCWTNVLARFALVLTVGVIAQPAMAGSSGNLLYSFDIVARSGDPGVSTIAGASLGSIGTNLSINSVGTAAFQAGLSTGGNGLFIAPIGASVATNINPVFSNNPGRTFSGAVQINKSNRVAARDQVSGAPPLNLIRLWDPGTGSSFTTIARGGSPTDPFDAVLAFPSVNENNEFVFSALTPSGSELATPDGAGGFNELPLPTPLLPRIAFNGMVVVRSGAAAGGSILLLPNNLALGGGVSIAGPATGFSSVGRAPSVNDDGSIIVFTGDRGNGTGVFASIATSGGARDIVKIAGEGVAGVSAINPPDLGLNDARQPVGFTSVALDSRVGIAHQRLGTAGLADDSFVVAFIADAPAVTQTDYYLSGVQFTGNRGIWTVRVDIFRKNNEQRYRLGPPMPVVQVGDVVNGSGPAGGSFGIDELPDLYDPIANVESDDGVTPRAVKAGEHYLAFWARNGTTHLVIRAKQVDTCLLRVQRLPQAGLNAPWRNSPYAGSSKTIGAIGCAMTGVAMQTNHLFQENKVNLGLSSVSGTNFDPQTINDFMVSNHTFDGRSVNTEKTTRAYNTLAQVTAKGLTCVYAGVDANSWMFDVPTRKGVLDPAKLPNALATVDPFVCEERAPLRIGVEISCEKVNPAVNDVDGQPKCVPQVDPSGAEKVDANGVAVAAKFSPGHYILIAGKVGSRYFLADPGHSGRKELSVAYNNTFETRGVVVDPVNASFVSAVSDGKVELTLTAPGGGRLGFDGTATGRFSEIPGGTYTRDALNDDVTGAPADEVTMQVYVPTPAAGNYQLRLTEIVAGPYVVNFEVFDDNGGARAPLQITGTAVPGLSRVFQIALTTAPGGANPTISLQSIIVPVVVGTTRARATSLISAAGLTLGTITTQSSTTVPAGSVISQNPASGTAVAPAATVSIVVSTGSGNVSVPNVVGQTQAAAQSAIVAAGLVVGTITTQASSTVPAGKVISQNPAAGTSVAAGSAVALVVSSGPAPVTVPNVVGQTQAAAQSAIVAAGLTVGTITTQASSTVPAGKVISQNPAAGTSVAAGSAVALVVSSGPAPVTVPNVVGQTQAAAQSAIIAAGLTVGTITTQASSTVPAGKVISQNPAAGASVAAGSAVALVVSSGPAPVTVPNVVGQTQAAAQSAIIAAGLTMGAVTTQASASVPAGIVLAQNPAASSSVASGTAVALVVSWGTPGLLTSQFTVTRSGLVLNRASNTFDQAVTLKSISATVVSPLVLSVTSISVPSVTLANKDALDPSGNPFIRIALPGGRLTAGQSVTVVLKFANPARSTFSYQPVIYGF